MQIGDKINRLTLAEFLGSRLDNQNKKRNWGSFLCECGNIKEATLTSVKTNQVMSCGCLLLDTRTKHGKSGTPTHTSWDSMIQRCTNINNPAYENYGGRGITVCESWLEFFENFYEDMGERPENTTLDRKDVNKNYCKENCVWSEVTQQKFNTRIRKTNSSGKTGVYFNKKLTRKIFSFSFIFTLYKKR